MFAERMMPGQKPYTPEERRIRDALVGDAARAEELIDIDELDITPTVSGGSDVA
jgi:hypothetical protein